MPLDAIILFQSLKKTVTESVNFISKEDKNYEHFPMKTTVIKYHCHKHASFLPILFCVYSVVWKKLFIWNFLLYAFLKQYTQRIQFFVFLFHFLFSSLYTVFSALYNKKKYLRFSLFNFFSTFLMIFHWHFPVCTILFWILLLVTLSCYWTFFLFYDHHQNENAFKKKEKKCAFLIYNFYDYTKWQISFFRSFVCSMMRDVRCSKYRLDCRFNMFFILLFWLNYLCCFNQIRRGCFHMRVKKKFIFYRKICCCFFCCCFEIVF